MWPAGAAVQLEAIGLGRYCLSLTGHLLPAGACPDRLHLLRGRMAAGFGVTLLVGAGLLIESWVALNCPTCQLLGFTSFIALVAGYVLA